MNVFLPGINALQVSLLIFTGDNSKYQFQPSNNIKGTTLLPSAESNISLVSFV